MSCMKCGRELEAGQMFCKECLAEMEAYPVKPETVVLLPKRKGSMAFKKTRQRRQTPEEQIAALEKRGRMLVAALFLSLLVLVSVIVGFSVREREIDLKELIGKNYSSYNDKDLPNIVDEP